MARCSNLITLSYYRQPAARSRWRLLCASTSNVAYTSRSFATSTKSTAAIIRQQCVEQSSTFSTLVFPSSTPTCRRRSLSSQAHPRTTSIDDASSANSVDDELFGYNPGGSAITNKDTILSDVDRALGTNKPPDIEVFLTDHVCNTSNAASTFIHLHLLRFGHVGIRYRTSDGVDRVMNINGDFNPRPVRRRGSSGSRHRDESCDDNLPLHHPTMVNFIPPEEFIFGTDGELAQQGGVYNRPFVSVRIENVAPGATDALHSYYEALHKASCIQPLPARRSGNETTIETEGNGFDVKNNKGNQGAVRFNLVDVNLSSLARLLPPPFDAIPLKIISFFQQRHEEVQRSKDEAEQIDGAEVIAGEGRNDFMESSSSSKNDINVDSRKAPSARTSSAIIQTANNIGHDIDNVVKDVGDAYHGIRDATFVAGNCAQWTSNGLAFCGLLRRPRIFPKAILIDLLEDEIFSGRTDNVNLVVYKQVDHAKKKTDWGGPFQYLRSAYVHPLRPIRNVWYQDPVEFANAIVSVPDGRKEAIVEAKTPSKQPKKIFLVISLANAVVPAAIMVGLVENIGPMGPISAAVWLGLNYWLY